MYEASEPIRAATRLHTEGLLRATQARARDPDAGEPAAVRGRVLYVEDNLVNIVLMQSIVGLRRALRIEVATSGDEGYARALAQPPDLMLIDMRLPDCSGIELLQRLRAHPRFASTPAVVVSAEGFPENVRRAREAGFSDYWTKPLDVEQTLARLDAWLPQPPDVK